MEYINKRRRAEHKIRQRELRKEWLGILKDNPVLNIFHKEKYKRDLNELNKI